MTFERCRDFQAVREIVCHPRIYQHLHDDYGPPPAEWEPVDHALVSYVLVRDEGEVIGLFIVAAHSMVLWELHQCFLPRDSHGRAIWGARAARAGVEFLDWIWAKTGCQRLIGNIVRSNRLALKYAKTAGMTEYGVNEKSFMKNGELQDQVCVGISRPKPEGK